MSLIPVLFTSAVFIGVGLLLNAKNAPYLLPGYNTLPPDEQAQFDINGHLRVHKPFFLWLGLGGAASYFVVSRLAYQDIAILVYLLLVLASTSCFLLYTQRFSHTRKQTVLRYLLVGIFVIMGLGVSLLTIQGRKINQLVFETNQLVISGMYGRTLPYSELTSALVYTGLPFIPVRKLEGFASGTYLKGKFTGANGQHVAIYGDLALVNWLCLKTKRGELLYWNSPNANINKVAEQIQQHIK